MHHPLEFRFDHDLKAEIVSARPLLRAEFVDDNYFRPNSTCKELFMPHLMQVYGGEALIRPTITEIELQDAHRPFVTVVAHTKIEWEERRCTVLASERPPTAACKDSRLCGTQVALQLLSVRRAGRTPL
eukprot:5665159-Prymnesium_polylepis.1